MRHSRVERSHPFWRSVALVTVALLAFGVSAATAVTYSLNSKVHYVDVAGLVGDNPSATATHLSDSEAGQAVNILLMGTDTRDTAEDEEIGGADGGARADTTIVLHISADRTRVELVSIPRDSMVHVPSCTMTDGSTSKATYAQFNSAFATGWDKGGDYASAAACTIKTVESNAQLTINYFVVVDFAGFQKMVDAVNGVQVCVDSTMKDSYTGLDLNPGLQTLNGEQALQFARARHVSGTDGSDLTRIKHQQQLMGALANEVLSKNVLTNAPQLLSFASAVTSSLTVDSRLSLTTITGLAYSLRGIDRANIVLMTIPNGPDPTDKNRVVWTSKADTVWAALASDTSVTAALNPVTTAPSATSSGAATTSPSAGASSSATPSPSATLPAGATSAEQVQQNSVATCGA